MALPGSRRFANIPPVLKNLLIINILMFVATFVVKRTFNVDLTRILGLYYFKSEYFQPYQLVTHMFMHGSLMHIFLNMFMLWMFGRILEQVWGGKRFLFYYFFTGLGAAALHLLVTHIEFIPYYREVSAFLNTPDPELFIKLIRENKNLVRPEYVSQWIGIAETWQMNPANTNLTGQAVQIIKDITSLKESIPTIGASGAVYGILLAFGVTFPNMPLILIFFPFFPIKAKYMVIGMGVLELVYGLSMPGSNVAHFAHLGGMIFGYILIRYWKIKGSDFY